MKNQNLKQQLQEAINFYEKGINNLKNKKPYSEDNAKELKETIILLKGRQEGIKEALKFINEYIG